MDEILVEKESLIEELKLKEVEQRETRAKLELVQEKLRESDKENDRLHRDVEALT